MAAKSSVKLLAAFGRQCFAAVHQQSSSIAGAGGSFTPPGQHTFLRRVAAVNQPHGSSARSSALDGAGSAGRNAAASVGAAAGPAVSRAAPSGVRSNQPQLSSFQKWWRDFQQIPPVPKFLGFMGAIPFIALAPPVCKFLAPVLPTGVAENCAMIQASYGVAIVTFLGAVHWGVAMATPLIRPGAVQIANEAFVYSNLAVLVALPVALMEPGPAAVMLSVLLPASYLADHIRRHHGLPAWYMALRAPLTILATFGMLLTATRYMYAELDRVKELEAAAASRKL